MARFNFLKSVRILLLPIACIYWLVVKIRNLLYDANIFKSTKFSLPIICIGNLSVGGTGKTPMVEMICEGLQNRYKQAILSRGYKRKTRGYTLAQQGVTALEIGDEPMQFFIKFPNITVAVGEERVAAVPQLLHDKPETEVIILDDAFQHRSIQAGLNILLTEFDNLFTRDFFLPVGNLRDIKSRYKKADIICVTKCPQHISNAAKQKIQKEINPLPEQRIFFNYLAYMLPYHILTKDRFKITSQTHILLLTGIANAAPIKKYLVGEGCKVIHLSYADHYIYRIDDLRKIKAEFEKIKAENKIIITTEKDAVRLFKFGQELSDLPLYVLPISHQFIDGDSEAFFDIITNYINTNRKK